MEAQRPKQMTKKFKLIFLTLLLITVPVFANIFETKVIIKPPEPIEISEIGDYLIDENSQSIKKIFDADNDGDLDYLDISSNSNSSSLSINLFINDGQDNYTATTQDFSEINIPDQRNIKLMDVYAEDLNADGLFDLWFHIKSRRQYCHDPVGLSFIYKNSGSNNFELRDAFFYDSHDSINPISRSIVKFEPQDNTELKNPTIYNLQLSFQHPITVKLINNNNFNFTMDKTSTLPFVRKIKTLDINNDGNQDIVTLAKAYQSCDEVVSTVIRSLGAEVGGTIWLGSNDGKFEATDYIGLPVKEASDISVLDINGDNLEDVVLQLGETINIYFKNTDNTFDDSFSFDHDLSIAKFADIDNDGLLDMVAHDGSYIPSELNMYKNNGNNTFTYVNSTNDLRGYTYKLHDMDNDGKVDIVYQIDAFYPGFHGVPHIVYNEGMFNFSERNHFNSSGLYIPPTSITDIDFDGLLDYVINPIFGSDGYFGSAAYNSDNKYIFKNLGNRNYEQIETDVLDVSYGLNYRKTYDFSFFDYQDLDNDGRADLFGITNETESNFRLFTLRVMMHEDNNQIQYYNNAEIVIQSAGTQFPSIDVADFNKDGLQDFIVSGNREIKLMTQVSNPSVAGLYYDPSHNGHGFSIEKMTNHNQYYTLFYSYDETGNSEWYLQLNRLMGTNKGTQLLPSPPLSTTAIPGNNISYNYNYSSNSGFINPKETQLGFMYNESTDDEGLAINFDLNDGTESISWDSKKLIGLDNKPEEDFSGMWWAGSRDSGWGLSLNFVQNTDSVDVFAILFFYDAQGKARWILGQAADFVPSQPLTLEMNMINGYGRNQNVVETTKVSAGTITINLNEASQDINQSGRMTMDVFYPRGEREDWIRNDIPITLFSKPRK